MQREVISLVECGVTVMLEQRQGPPATAKLSSFPSFLRKTTGEMKCSSFGLSLQYLSLERDPKFKEKLNVAIV